MCICMWGGMYVCICMCVGVCMCVYVCVWGGVCVYAHIYTLGFPGGVRGKELAYQCRRLKRLSLNPWVRKIPWRRKRPPTPVFLPGKFHGQRSLVSMVSPWCCKSWTQLKQLSTYACVCVYTHTHTHTHTHTYICIYTHRRKKWQTTPVFLPEKSHGQRSLEGYCLWRYKSQTQLVTKPLSDVLIKRENICGAIWI